MSSLRVITHYKRDMKEDWLMTLPQATHHSPLININERVDDPLYLYGEPVCAIRVNGDLMYDRNSGWQPYKEEKENTSMTRTIAEIVKYTQGVLYPGDLTKEEQKLWESYCSIDKAINAVEDTHASQKQLSIAEVLVERGTRYGPFAGHARITQALKQDMRCRTNWDSLTDAQQEALEMIAHKIGRILNGDPNYLDSWVDIVGYMQLVIDELNAQPKEKAK